MPNKNPKKAPVGVPQGMVTRADIVYKPGTYRDSDNSVEFTLATEAPVRVFDWERFDVIKEIIAADGVVIPKTGQVPLVDSHDRSTIENILGSVREIRVEGSEVVGRLYFASSESAQRALAMIREGHLDSGSVGYEQVESIWIPEKEALVHNNRSFEGPVLLTKSWALKEFSLVAIGADPYAKARAEEPETVILSREAVEPNFKEKNEMENEKKIVEQPQTVDVEAIKREAINAEALRAAKITELCTRHNCPELAAEFIRTSANIESVQDKILDTLASRTTAVSTASRVEMGKEETEKYREAAVDGIIMRAGMRVEKPAEGANQLRSVSMVDIARGMLEKKGISTTFMGKTDILERALSTSDFPNILANVANKSVIIGYKAAAQTWRAWAKMGMLPDFKQAKRVSLDDIPSMVENPAGQEIEQAVFGDNGEAITLKTYARKLTITRQALINDDTGIFNSLFRLFGYNAANLIESSAYGVLTGNANMADGGALFNTTAVTTTGGHANRASSGAVISSTTVDAAQIAMGAQVAPNGMVLSLMPQFLICGFANKMAAEILCNSTTDTTLTGNADFNPFRGLTPIVSGHVPGKKWFASANPNQIDTVEVAFLDGRDTPTVYQVENSGDILGRTYVGYIDLAAKALEWRSMYYNAGQ